MLRTIEIDLKYQPTIEQPPVQNSNELIQRAAQSDQPTVNHWRNIWIDLTQKAKERFGNFADKSIGKLHGINRHKPAICIGSGPSLKNSIEALRENRKLEHPVLTISCLHNFGYFEDEDCHADYYLTLDSGDIIVDDIFESRKEKAEFYWEKTKDKTLLATLATPPKLFDLWKGPIYLFNVIIPEKETQDKLQAIERFAHYIAPGGNALGGCVYVAKAIFGSDPIIFVGADFCFDHNNTFHSYKTHYDTLGGFVTHPDVFGIPRSTWPSYLRFKYYLDWLACNVPGHYISCSEGLLGAYKEGNIRQFKYMPLKDALLPYAMSERVYLQKIDPMTGVVLGKDEIRLKDLFSNSQYPTDMTIY